MVYIILISLTLGIAFGNFISPEMFKDIDKISTIALNLLIFSVGVDIGLNKEVLTKIKKKGVKILLVPLAVVIGSLFGGLIVGLIFKLQTNLALAISAGFGWYSLSAVILTNLAGAEAGTVAFLSNVFRELLAVLSIGFIASKINYITAIAPSGATAMDTTLPVISKFTDEETVVIAFLTGTILTFLVPFLVPFFYNI
ncbi:MULTISPECIES: lysine exporter LysO family protein [Caloramator]|uniref:Putative surface protein n=2 Tax=Caloramator TaxID=44258 RepID=G0V3J4_9CLOT|nr:MULTISPECIES: lysine exporter LysO family protein [Caloramator]MDO6353719.1 lysine exporter LysO family protein [Caloramator sp. CAR-1]CCC57684.1 putative surface protein [Caloramator australicus RC3]